MKILGFANLTFWYYTKKLVICKPGMDIESEPDLNGTLLSNFVTLDLWKKAFVDSDNHFMIYCYGSQN